MHQADGIYLYAHTATLSLAQTLGGGFIGGYRGRLVRATAWLTAAIMTWRGLVPWLPGSAFSASMAGALVSSFYGPLVSALVYNRGKRSGHPFRFHVTPKAALTSVPCLGASALPQQS